MKQKQRQVGIYMGIAIVVLVVLAFAIGSSGGSTRGQLLPRNSPEEVGNRIQTSLTTGDATTLFTDMAPSIKDNISLSSIEEVLQSPDPVFGKLLSVEQLISPQILTGADFIGDVADGKLRLNYENGSQDYYYRLVLEEGGWYFLASFEEYADE